MGGVRVTLVMTELVLWLGFGVKFRLDSGADNNNTVAKTLC